MTLLPDAFLEPARFESFQDIIDTAHLGYVELSYHNFAGHIQETIDAVPEFCGWAKSNGITDIPQKPLAAVMANHDYELHLPLEIKHTVTDEVHSALDLGRKLIQFPEGREVLGLCVQGVIATTPNLEPRNNFQLAARMIDTVNVCSKDAATALKNTLNVIIEEEIELKTRKTDSFIEKRDKLANFLRTFYYPGAVEFVSEDGFPVSYEPALIGYENVKKLGSISRQDFIDLIPEAEEAFAIMWPERKLF